MFLIYKFTIEGKEYTTVSDNFQEFIKSFNEKRNTNYKEDDFKILSVLPVKSVNPTS
jgi:hypothetical protein